jgi:UDP-glucose 4-epimerase
MKRMRVAVTGATGNVGTSLIRVLADDRSVQSIVGIARRVPTWLPPKTAWVAADVATDDLVACFRGADAVVHLAWLVQPSHRRRLLERVNVHGSGRVFNAVAKACVPNLVVASSVGAYSAGPKDRFVDETWPARGIATSAYSRQKARVETLLDAFESEHPEVRSVRLRPALIFQRDAGSEIRRYFLGRLFPRASLRGRLPPLFPSTAGLRLQAVHSHDIAEAYRLALVRRVSGAFNVAADGVIDAESAHDQLGSSPFHVSSTLARAVVATTWRLRVQPTGPGWLDMGIAAPLMDCSRIRRELGWQPRRTAFEALADVLSGIRDGASFPTPPLAA